MVDYSTRLDTEMLAYLAKCDALYPPDAISLDVAGQRDVYNQMCAAFDRGRPDGLEVADEDWAGVPCRRYEPEGATATVVYYHGGGFVVGGLDSHDSICAEISAATGARLIAVDYPLAPETSYPADFKAALAMFYAVAGAYPGPVVLAGDSAGACLAASVSHAARRSPVRPKGQVLIYGAFGGARDLPSYVEHAEAPQLTARDVDYYLKIRTGGADTPTGDPNFAALQDKDFANLPPTVCFAAECDPLASDSVVYAKELTDAGSKAVCVTEAGLIHGYLRARGMSQHAAHSFDRITGAIAGLAEGQWPPTAL